MATQKKLDFPLASRSRKWDAAAAGDRVRTWSGGPDKEDIDWDKFFKAHFWRDDEMKEEFAGYKLLYVDIIDGEAHAIPRAIFAVAAVLQGGRGGADIPESDQNAIKGVVSKWYAQMRKEFDDDSIVPPWEKQSSSSSRKRKREDLERRCFPAGQLRAVGLEEGAEEGPKIVGHAVVFDRLSEELWGFREKFAPGAFADTLEADIRALVNHDPNFVLGRTINGTLELAEDEHGLAVEIVPPTTSWAADVLVSIQREDINQMSFGFHALEEEWETINGENIRTVTKAELFDVSIVTFPAYPDTNVGLRNLFRAEGFDYDALARVVVRSQQGLTLLEEDHLLIRSVTDQLLSLLPPEEGAATQRGAQRSDAGEEKPQRRLSLLKKRLDLAERSA